VTLRIAVLVKQIPTVAEMRLGDLHSCGPLFAGTVTPLPAALEAHGGR
jgi:hypothetical protein